MRKKAFLLFVSFSFFLFCMYYEYHHGQPLPSLPLPQQRQSLYIIAPPHHHHHSLPPPPTKFYLPLQLIQQQQLQHYHQTHNRQRNNFHHHNNNLNHQNYQFHRHNSNSSSQIPINIRRSLSDTATLTAPTTNRKFVNTINDTPESMKIGATHRNGKSSIVHTIRSTADWIVKTFCFCFTDDNTDVIEFKNA